MQSARRMSYSTCPNCGETVASAVTLGPPTTCPECCARLLADVALAPRRETGPAESLELDLAMVAGSGAPRTARSAFISFAAHLEESVSSTATLLISELVSNAVLHGPAAATVALHCAILGGTLQVEIADDGPGFIPRMRSAGDDIGSGWGLHMVDTLADAWGVDEGKPTCVWFELAL